ncbi:hypothetical protein AGABI2DRAFT_224958, partial [Agaricus bisporus var. bisporus H97]|uniref:hypothetical protein n=1 Tax=Agaricus bisporus var. bisporus (strain H97 / ATCC MYA-4626 / FGSC 10389) TaxID=936046 RepID=UPI00029F68BF
MAANSSPPQSMPVSDAVLRRRSADVGGLYLALRDSNHGLGWLDSSTPSDPDFHTKHAVLLSTMHTETLRLLENSVVQNDPPDLSQEDRVRLLKNIESWYFEPLRMPEHEVLACVIFLFQVLFRIEGMQEAVNINFNIIPRFILHIRQLYRWQNHYHNFEHAVDVLQAIHCYLRAAGVVPPVSLLLLNVDAPNGGGMWSSTRQPDSEPLVTCLTHREIFALYLAAIGHDVAHPGFNNPFMENAEAPLSQVYENGSALEQMHSYMLLKTMRYHGLGVLLDDPETGTRQHFRRILRGSVLATDMGVHNDFMNKFAKLLENSRAGDDDDDNNTIDWQAAKFERQEFVCKLLLKNADISNPSRPFLVSKQWASALQQEWACQYKFENYLELTHSVNPSNGPLAEANSQVFFTGKIAKPLVDMTAVAIPELRQYSYHCAENLREWELILKTIAPTTTSSSSSNPVSPRSLKPTSDNDYSGRFRLTRPKGSSSTATSP